MRIAQQFIAGKPWEKTPSSPVGTAELFSRPYGTRFDITTYYPAMNCWAIFECPYGTSP